MEMAESSSNGKKTLWHKSSKLSQDTPVLPQAVKLVHNNQKREVEKKSSAKILPLNEANGSVFVLTKLLFIIVLLLISS